MVDANNRTALDQLLIELGEFDRITNNPLRAALLCDNLGLIVAEGQAYAGVPELKLDAVYAQIAAGYARKLDATDSESAEEGVYDKLVEYFQDKSSYFKSE